MPKKMIIALAMLSASVSAHAQQAPTQGQPAAKALQNRTFPFATHIGFVVKDARSAAKRTIIALGLPSSSLVVDLVMQVKGGQYKGHPADFSVQVAIIETGNIQMEYMQPVRGVSPYADALADGQKDIAHHIAYVVPSIDMRLAEERKLNPAIKVVLDAPLPGGAGRYVYVSGVLPGILAEFIETTLRSGQ